MKKTACPTCMLHRGEGSKTLTVDLVLFKVTNYSQDTIDV
jgi:hypothetical protein